jgi:hypothetical protein
MKANEVRIGNLVEYIDDIDHSQNREWQLNKINDMDITILVNQAPHHNYRGIQLTEDWLFKFGFELEKTPYCKVYSLYREVYFQYFIPKIKNYHYNGLRFQDFGNEKIKSVHQLQNLFFALTGCELEVGEAFLK